MADPYQKVLVCGGAGYIGSHVMVQLLETGYEVVCLDNYSTGWADTIDKIRDLSPKSSFTVVETDLRNESKLYEALNERGPFLSVMHLSAFSQVGESCREPLLYYDNNVGGAISLLKVLEQIQGKTPIHFIFSSTAAVYGEVGSELVTEDTPKAPKSPYGETKMCIETLLESHRVASNGLFKYVTLRYFNAAGAHPSGKLGERHEPESHLIPIVLEVASGKRHNISIFGTDYPTKDGTCVRDYIHVMDIASAHLRALEYLIEGGKSDVFNLGNGDGYSVKQVIEVARQVTGHKIPVIEADRRAGDPAILVASSKKARKILGWTPIYSSLSEIVAHAWNFHKTCL